MDGRSRLLNPQRLRQRLVQFAARLKSPSVIAFTVIVLLTVLFRLPCLVNAGDLNSDAAIASLQARHILRGEFSFFLWGTGYQGSFDSAALAVGFALFRPTPLVAMLVPLAGYILVIGFTYAMLQRWLSASVAALGTLPLVFAPSAVSGVGLYAPRQWSITSVFVAIWLLDRAALCKRPWIQYILSGQFLIFSLYLDLFGLQFVPAVALFALLTCLDDSRSPKTIAKRFSAFMLGSGAGLVLLWLVRRTEVLPFQPTTLSFSRVPHNWRLFWDSCLPLLLGYKTFFPDLWKFSASIHALQTLGGASLVLFIVLGLVWSGFRRIPWQLRRLGLLSVTATASTIGGFLVSTSPFDAYAVRYLAPIIWTAPLALGSLAFLLGRFDRVLVILAPYTIVAAFATWTNYGSYVNGLRLVRTERAVAKEEARLGSWLRRHKIKYGAAQYWLSYRLSFLFHEMPVIVPIDKGQDRYPPFRQAFERERRVAYLFHPSEPRATAATWEPRLRQECAKITRREIADFTVLLCDRKQ